jgi:uncharacterized SAM-binding protein YcdF (DUF218 family)
MLAVYVWAITVYGFLAQNVPTGAPVLIVEGYVPDAALDSVAAMWMNNPSLLIVCAGLPVQKGTFCIGYESYADYNAAYLRAQGVDTMRVVSAPAQATRSERTYTTAVAARQKIETLGVASGKVDVVCMGTHARRSRFLYRKAFGEGWDVGAVSVRHSDDPLQWWHTSEGARAVVYEMFAYIYCVLFFHP